MKASLDQLAKKYNLEIVRLDDFEVDYEVNLAADCECSINSVQYYHSPNGDAIEITSANIVKINGELRYVLDEDI